MYEGSELVPKNISTLFELPTTRKKCFKHYDMDA